MEADTEDSTVQGLRDRRTKLISKKCWRKIKKKVFKRRNWLILNVQIILILVLKNLSHQNIVSYVASYILMVLLLSIMDE